MWARTVLLTRQGLRRVLVTSSSIVQSARVGGYSGKTAVQLGSFSKAMATSYIDQESALKLDIALFNDYMFSIDQLMEIAGLCVAQVTACLTRQFVFPLLALNASQFCITMSP